MKKLIPQLDSLENVLDFLCDKSLLNCKCAVGKNVIVLCFIVFLVQANFSYAQCPDGSFENPNIAGNFTFQTGTTCFTTPNANIEITDAVFENGANIYVAPGVTLTVNNITTTLGYTSDWNIQGSLILNQSPVMNSDTEITIGEQGVLDGGFTFSGSGSSIINNYNVVTLEKLELQNTTSGSVTIDNNGDFTVDQINTSSGEIKIRNQNIFSVNDNFQLSDQSTLVNCGNATANGGFNLEGGLVVNTGTFEVLNGSLDFSANVSNSEFKNYGEVIVDGDLNLADDNSFYNEGLVQAVKIQATRALISGPQDILNKTGYFVLDEQSVTNNENTVGPNLDFKLTTGASTVTNVFSNTDDITFLPNTEPGIIYIQDSSVTFDCALIGNCANTVVTAFNCANLDGSVNYLPVAVTDNYEAVENEEIILNPLNGDYDPDGGSIEIVSINGVELNGSKQNISVTNGAVTISETGEITLIPDTDFTGEIQFSYTITDNAATDSIATAQQIINYAAAEVNFEIVKVDIQHPENIIEDIPLVLTESSDTPVGQLSYSISNTTYAAIFEVTAAGILKFREAPNYENPQDVVGLDNTYGVIVTVTDEDGNSTETTVDIEVTDVIEEANILVSQFIDVEFEENQSIELQLELLQESDDPIGNLSYEIIDESYKSLFTVSETGLLTWNYNPLPDYENPLDVAGNNIYDFVINVTDEDQNITVPRIRIIITDVIETTELELAYEVAIGYAENTTVSLLPTLIGDPIGEFVYSISGGLDADLFTINSESGELILQTQDYENPSDSDSNNVYELVVTVIDSDGNLDSTTVSITIDDIEETTTLELVYDVSESYNENTSISLLPTLIGDPIGEFTYSISGGLDADLFTINSESGELTLAGQNYESPQDSDGDNSYEVDIIVRDSDNNSATSNVIIVISDQNEIVSLDLSDISEEVSEGTSYSSILVLTGEPIGIVTFEITGGNDQEQFSVNAITGALNFVEQDYENPVDTGFNNHYTVEITARDDDDNFAISYVDITILDVQETTTLELVYDVSEGYEENTSISLLPVLTGDPIGEFAYSISGGLDADLFTINSESGELILQAQDYENPNDSDSNNVYEVAITVTDSDGNLDSTTVSITIDDIEETTTLELAYDFSEGYDENISISLLPTLTGDPIGEFVYSISGGLDTDLFTINSESGELILQAQDYENPNDSDSNNVYEVVVTVTDSDGNLDSTTVSITIDDIEETTTLELVYNVSEGYDENTSISLLPILTGDPIGEFSYSISGGLDADLFTINSESGELILTAQDYENPSDSDSNNVYEVAITVTDSDGNLDSTTVSITIDDIEETTTLELAYDFSEGYDENTSISLLPTLTGDPIGEFVYSISGGLDADLFTINSESGELVLQAQDYENPSDSNIDNIYEVVITVTDSDGNSYTTPVTIVIDNVEESSTLDLAYVVAAGYEENTTVSLLPTLTGDPIGEFSYSISGGLDGNLFEVDSASGELVLVIPDYQNPQDSNGDNIYEVEITVTDSDANLDNTIVTINVLNTNEAPVAIADRIDVESTILILESVSINVVINDLDDNNAINTASVDLDPSVDGIQTSVNNDDGVYIVDANGVVSFTPNTSLEDNPTPIVYVVSDEEGFVSNEATITIIYAVDSDGDGVSDEQEIEDGTNPNDSCDSDRGLPLSTDDCDGDGLTTSEEETGIDDDTTEADPNGVTSDPNNEDTDGDGVNDGQEAIDGTNPNDSCDSVGGISLASDDCDNDGLTNNEEETGEDDPSTEADPGGVITNPNDSDTDDDGISDGQEAMDGTDPNNPCSVLGTPPDSCADNEIPVANNDESLDNESASDIIIDLLADNGNGIDYDPDGELDSSSISITNVNATDKDLDGDNDQLVVDEGIWNIDNNGILTFEPSISIQNNPSPIFYTIKDTEGNESNEASITITFDGIESVAETELEFFEAVTDVTGFTIGGVEYLVHNTLEIYNRWGVKVFEAENYGKNNGELFKGISKGRATIAKEEKLPVGTYYYVFNYTKEDGNSSQKIGYLYFNR